MAHKAVFLDRDGTICEEVGYITHLKQLKLLPGSIEAIKMINKRGLKAVVITNQAGVARGYFSEEFLHKVHLKLKRLLKQEGAYLGGIYYCPHHPDSKEERYRKVCDCRKPAPGLLIKASQELDLDLANSYLIGDNLSDIESAHKMGVKGILVLTGYGQKELKNLTEQESLSENPSLNKKDSQVIRPELIASDLLTAVKWVLADLSR